MTKPSVPIYGGIISTKSSVRAVSEVDGNVPPGHDTGAETPVTNTEHYNLGQRSITQCKRLLLWQQ